MLFIELKLNRKEGAANERTYLCLFIKFVKKNYRWEKMSKAVEEKKIESYDENTSMRIQLILENYVYRKK